MTNTTKYYQGTRGEVLLFLPRQYSRVLEIGCGEGDFRENLNQECEYWGIEPVQTAANIASNKMNKVLVGTYQDVIDELPKNYFDLIICNDVIEHMLDHDEFFQLIKINMSKNASIVGSIPNVRYFWNLFEVLVKKDWKYVDSGVLDRTHLRFFTEKSLKQIFRDNGFEVEKFQGINIGREKAASMKKYFIKFFYHLTILFFGQDLKFIQFGFRIKVND